MNEFEKLKALRDAGFPQQPRLSMGGLDGEVLGGFYLCSRVGNDECATGYYTAFELNKGHADGYTFFKSPTLSELIEACDGDFEALVRYTGTWGAITSREKYMMPNNSTAQVGATPEEAVMNLWLALNKK